MMAYGLLVTITFPLKLNRKRSKNVYLLENFLDTNNFSVILLRDFNAPGFNWEIRSPLEKFDRNFSPAIKLEFNTPINTAI
jgi:hypothetical protein